MIKMKTVLLLLLVTLTTAERIRRNRVFPASGLEFGRIVDRMYHHDELEARQLDGMSMPEDAAMSFDTAMSFADVEETMSFDTAMSFPLDTDMSFDFDGGDIGTVAPSSSPTPAPTALSIPNTCSDLTPAELAALDSTSVSIIVEVDTTSPDDSFLDELTGPLLVATAEELSVCSSASRALVVARRKLEEDIVAVELGSETGVSTDQTCLVSADADADTTCHVANVVLDIYVDEGSSLEEAQEEVLKALAAQLDDENLIEGTTIVGIRLRESDPVSDSPFNHEEGSPEEGSSGRSPAQKAMISILALAGASVAFVVVQRRYGQKKRGDSKSVASSIETASNTGYDTTAIGSEATSIA